MDTPGLLDRELEKRNKIELQGLAALEHIADLLVFVFDPTETCGYSMETQNNLLAHIKTTFTEVPIIEASNKTDLGTAGPGIQISARDNIGMETLMNDIKAHLKKQGKKSAE